MSRHDDTIDPPGSYTVEFARKPVLYTHDGRALVRVAGFRGVQTTGVNSPLHDNTQRRPPKKGKR